MELSDLNVVNKEQVNHAGARYTPHIDPEAPNVQVSEVLQPFDALAYSDRLGDRLDDLADELEEEWNRAPEESKKAFRRRKQSPERVVELLESISNRSPDDDKTELRQLTRATRFAKGKTSEVSQELRSQLREEEEENQRDINNKISLNRNLLQGLESVSAFVEGLGLPLLRDKALFLKGEWGTGKTHFLCDLTDIRMEESLPTLLVLAETLPDSDSPLEGICELVDSVSNPEQLLSELQSLGEEAGERALLLIDGINEADRELWRDELASVAEQVEDYSHVGLALSCRTPFDEQILTSRAENHLVQVQHRGFEENEFDAQIEFFDYYDVPAPHVPLLTPEFSRPLFLKILCEAITRRDQSDQQGYLRSVASGQRSMTDILEHFAREIGEDIESDFGLNRKTCWRILKGTSTGPTHRSGIAGIMADEMQEYVTKEDAIDAITDETSLSEPEAWDLLDRMISDGLLAETLHRNEGTTEAVRFPYQRFGDHIIARHLLAEHLNTDSETAVRRSFYVDRPLGQIFELEGNNQRFAEPGLAEAITVEFPQRIKRVDNIPEDERELAFYIPKKRSYGAPLKDVFLDGLYWRSADSFTDQTDDLMGFYLEELDEGVQRETFDVLVGLASRPGHPYDADRLYEYLDDMKMAERDGQWSEYLRRTTNYSTVHRVLKWVETAPIDEFSENTARNAVTLLSTFLTTTDRHLRDRITHKLYLVGLAHPGLLFEENLQTFSFDDPYVRERMLASCYGVAMSLWADPDGNTLRSEIPRFAGELVRRMFQEDSDYGTKHILARQYAGGVIELARKVDGDCISQDEVDLTDPPLDQIDSPFQDPDSIDESELKDVGPALHMDFSNYSVGGLVPDRGNYVDDHPEYQAVLKQIKKRVQDLGYSYEDFGSIDDEIDQRNTRHRDETKVDRYGKKYSWIAYFEMYGNRVDEGVLPTYEDEVRPPDCDIDPSFPTEIKEWIPELPELFETGYSEYSGWISGGPDPTYEDLFVKKIIEGLDGPWILLDGTIEQASVDALRIFTFLRGVLIAEEDVSELKQKLQETEYPGNRNIPKTSKDHYTYAGEIPWSERYGPFLSEEDGSAKRNVERAFGSRIGSTSGVQVEIPVHTFAWESHHSRLNQVSGMRFPAPALCEYLNLVNHNQTSDLFESGGERATIYREFRFDNARYDSWLLYIRKDLLEEYLEETDQTIAWLPWGERTLDHNELQAKSDELSKLHNNYEHINKGVISYQDYISDR
jgi:hypothetical protein